MVLLEKKKVFLFLTVSIFLIVLTLADNKLENKSETQRIEIDSSVYTVLLAKNYKARAQGLSGIEELSQSSGMLFIFPFEDTHGIWMKDMNIPLDILWIDGYKRIIHIEENVLPESYPKIYKPEKNARFVLELASGTVQRNKIQLGEKIIFL